MNKTEATAITKLVLALSMIDEAAERQQATLPDRIQKGGDGYGITNQKEVV